MGDASSGPTCRAASGPFNDNSGLLGRYAPPGEAFIFSQPRRVSRCGSMKMGTEGLVPTAKHQRTAPHPDLHHRPPDGSDAYHPTRRIEDTCIDGAVEVLQLPPQPHPHSLNQWVLPGISFYSPSSSFFFSSLNRSRVSVRRSPKTSPRVRPPARRSCRVCSWFLRASLRLRLMRRSSG